MDNNKVSIIVPIYNTARYLEKCLNSICNQTHRSLEIILVNDGSKDESETIAIEFSKKDSRIIYFHQENKGVSIARNTGLNIATGDYVLFCDSDDYYPTYAVSSLVHKATIDSADVVIGDFYRKSRIHQRLIKTSRQASPLHFIESVITGVNHGGPWTKMFRREVLKNISFKEEIKFREDALFLAEVLLKNPRISYLHEPIYFYTIRKGSTVNSLTLDALKSSFRASSLIEDQLRGKVSTESIRTMHALDAYSLLVNSAGHLNPDLIQKYLLMAKSIPLPIHKRLALTLIACGLYHPIIFYKHSKNFIQNAIAY